MDEQQHKPQQTAPVQHYYEEDNISLPDILLVLAKEITSILASMAQVIAIIILAQPG